MAYGITCTGTRVDYWVDQGDTLPLFWKIQNSDGTFASITHPATFTVTPKTGAPMVLQLVEVPEESGGPHAIGAFDTSVWTDGNPVPKGYYEVAYYDPALDVSLRGQLRVK